MIIVHPEETIMWQLRASLLFGLITCQIFIALVAAVFALIYRTGAEDRHEGPKDPSALLSINPPSRQLTQTSVHFL